MLDSAGLGGLTHQQRRFVLIESVGAVRGAHVCGQFDHHRATGTVAQCGESAPHDVAHLIRRVNRFDAFNHVAITARSAVVRTHPEAIERYATRQHQNRHIVSIRLRKATERILRTGLVLHGNHAETLSIADTAESVCRHHRAAFMAKSDRPYTELGDRLDERIRWVTGKPFHAFALEDLCDQVDAIH